MSLLSNLKSNVLGGTINIDSTINLLTNNPGLASPKFKEI